MKYYKTKKKSLVSCGCLNYSFLGFLSNRLIFFGGYGYLPEDKVLGTFEFDETSFWVNEVSYLPMWPT